MFNHQLNERCHVALRNRFGKCNASCIDVRAERIYITTTDGFGDVYTIIDEHDGIVCSDVRP